MAKFYRAMPRFLKAGEGTRVIVSGQCHLEGGVITAPFLTTGGASLSIWNSATSTINATTMNRLFVRAAKGDSTALPDFPATWSTGMSVSLSGTGARAVIYVTEMK